MSGIRGTILATVLIVLAAIHIADAVSIPIIHAFQRYEELIIVYPHGYDIQRLKDFGCSIERVFARLDMALVVCPTTVRGAIEKLGVEVTPNFNVSIDVTVNSFRLYKSVKQIDIGEQRVPLAWSWAASRVGADIVWRYLGVTGYGATIAILDTGIDPTHPLLAHKLRGWIEFDRKGRPVCSSPRDTYGHGTWVASIAAGGDTSMYIFGVAPYANIIVALVLPGGYGTAAQVLAGLEWSLEPYDCKGDRLGVKPDVVSMSFGATANYSNVFLQAIAKLIENGITPVAAIGNSGPHTTSNPGNIWGVIGVGATDFDNDIAWFSSYEDVEWPEPPFTWPFGGGYQKMYRKPDVVSPGVDVPGAFPGELLAIGSGTSASTPIVAGIAAMVSRILISKGFSGAKLVEEVYSIITSTATPIDAPGSGYGLVNAFKAVSKALDRAINTVEVRVEPSTVTLLDEMNIYVKGIIEGMEITVYIAGSEIYRGIYRSGKSIVVKVPPTHIGGNEVIVIDRGGMYYGESLVWVSPSIFIAPRNTTIGGFVNVVVSGLGIADMIAIYIESNILTLDIANLRGSYLGRLAPPYLYPGTYTVTLEDFTTPRIRLSTTIDIVDGRKENVTQIINRTEVYNYTNIVKQYIALPITINAKQHYVFNTIDYIDVATAYPNITIAGIELKSVHNNRISYSVINITEIFSNVYRIWFTVNAPESIDEEDVILSIEIRLGNTSISYPVPIKLLAVDPIKKDIGELEREVGRLNSSLLAIDAKTLNMSKNLTEVLENLETTSGRVYELYTDVKIIERNITHYGYTINYITRRMADIDDDMEFIERFTYIILAMAITSTAITVLSAIYVRRMLKG
ncbi:MAG: S8 family serine peptidase [Ignisphaera sp.]|uniref:Peptidase S8/S53 domain-containing protein n=1 Tax=Ignisphaera aggregans TaxID=334771 RepID=A0A7J3JQX7_9CREN